MQRITALIVAAALLLSSQPLAAQQPLSNEDEAAALRQMAAAIPLGSRIKVRTKGGRGITATLMAVEPDGIVIRRASRAPEPALGIAFADLADLHREQKSGFSTAKALGVGLAAGAGAILTLFAIAVALDD